MKTTKLIEKISGDTVTFKYGEKVIMTGHIDDPHAIQVIKWLRENLNLGLYEAKLLWDRRMFVR